MITRSFVRPLTDALPEERLTTSENSPLVKIFQISLSLPLSNSWNIDPWLLVSDSDEKCSLHTLTVQLRITVGDVPVKVVILSPHPQLISVRLFVWVTTLWRGGCHPVRILGEDSLNSHPELLPISSHHWSLPRLNLTGLFQFCFTPFTSLQRLHLVTGDRGGNEILLWPILQLKCFPSVPNDKPIELNSSSCQ